MNDLEDRLRTSLGALADTVPESPHARADLDQRLAGGPRRRVLLMAAAAAVVVAAAAVPVAMSGGGPGTAPVATEPASTEAASSPDYLAGPVELGRFGPYRAVLYVLAKGSGEDMCVAEEGPERPQGLDLRCEQVPSSWPAKPMGWVLERSVLGGNTPDSGPLPHLMLFVVAPQVHELEVRAGGGDPVPLELVAQTRGAKFYLADFGGSKQGFGYTAKDVNGTVLVNAIT